MTATAPTNRRRWLRFSVRTILVLMVVMAMSLAWKVNRARAQRKAVEALRNAGVDVVYDYEDSASANGQVAVPPVPAVWVDLFGIDYFADVYGVYFLNSLEGPAHFRDESTGFPEHVFDDIQMLPTVSSVIISEATDDELDKLSHAASIDTLIVSGNFTDAGVAHLSRLERLKHLYIMSPNMSVDGLCQLRRCTRLEQLIANGGTDMSEYNLCRLRDSLPNCSVSYGPRPLTHPIDTQ